MTEIQGRCERPFEPVRESFARFQVDTDGFGMGGIGGALGWSDAEHRLAFGYVTRRMLNHDRALAVYEAAAKVAGFEPAVEERTALGAGKARSLPLPNSRPRTHDC
jgi:CubicO group peptidase (beta-lactamase class C family)